MTARVVRGYGKEWRPGSVLEIRDSNEVYTFQYDLSYIWDVWPNGKALDYESRDSRFDPVLVHISDECFFCHLG